MLELSSDDVEVDPRVVELSVHSAATSQPYRTPLALLSRLIEEDPQLQRDRLWKQHERPTWVYCPLSCCGPSGVRCWLRAEMVLSLRCHRWSCACERLRDT
jgi:hypothetical protein